MTFCSRPDASRRFFTTAVLVCLLGMSCSDAFAVGRPGMVTTKRGEKYVGDVDETVIPGQVLIIDAGGHKIQVFRQNVQDPIRYFANNREEFDARMANLGAKDAAGRVALARWALAKNEIDLAVAAAASAKAIDPSNADVVALDRQIAVVRPPPPVKPPENQPPATAPAAAAGGPAKRMVTADEIQIIRMREMPENDRTTKLQIPPSAKQLALDAGLIQPNEVRNIQLQDLAMRILKDPNAPPGLRKQVKIVGDPAPLTEFRQKINKPLIAGCAAAACHGDNTTTNFRLFAPAEKEEASLSNFVVMQKYTKTTDGVERSMLNRTQPLASLLLGYMMPPELSRVPHPATPAYKGMIKTAQDPVFAFTMEWMGKSLIPVPASYEDIDLSKAAAAPKPGDTPVVPEPPPTRRPGTPVRKTGT